MSDQLCGPDTCSTPPHRSLRRRIRDRIQWWIWPRPLPLDHPSAPPLPRDDLRLVEPGTEPACRVSMVSRLSWRGRLAVLLSGWVAVDVVVTITPSRDGWHRSAAESALWPTTYGIERERGTLRMGGRS